MLDRLRVNWKLTIVIVMALQLRALWHPWSFISVESRGKECVKYLCLVHVPIPVCGVTIPILQWADVNSTLPFAITIYIILILIEFEKRQSRCYQPEALSPAPKENTGGVCKVSLKYKNFNEDQSYHHIVVVKEKQKHLKQLWKGITHGGWMHGWANQEIKLLRHLSKTQHCSTVHGEIAWWVAITNRKKI